VNLSDSNAVGRTTLPWVLRCPAERVGFDEHGLKGIDELLELAEEDSTFPNAATPSVKILAQQLDDETVSAHAQSKKSRSRYEAPASEPHSRSDLRFYCTSVQSKAEAL
jgi:hypothetical protein